MPCLLPIQAIAAEMPVYGTMLQIPRIRQLPVARLQPDQTPRENGIFARFQRALSQVNDFLYEEETTILITPEFTTSDLVCLAGVFFAIASIYSETQTD